MLEEALAEQPDFPVAPLPARLRRGARGQPRRARSTSCTIAVDAAERFRERRDGRGLRLDPRRPALPRLTDSYRPRAAAGPDAGAAFVPASTSVRVAGQPDAGGELAQRRHRIGFRPRDEQHGAVALVAHERVDEQLQAERERERLVRLLAAERDELAPPRRARRRTSPQVIAPIETSATTGSPSELGIPIASGFVPASFGPPSGWPSRARRGRRQHADEAASASRRT